MAAGVRFNKSAFKNNAVARFPERLEHELVFALEDMKTDMRDEMRYYIETVDSGIVDDKHHRIWTGKMRDSVDYTSTKIDGGKYRATVGWVKTMEEYFAAQEYGRGTGAGGSFANTAPMYMMSTIANMMDPYVYKSIQGLLRGLTR